MKKNKVAIHIPAIDNKSETKKGFLRASEVLSLEKLLRESPAIDFMGNIDFHKVRVENNKFVSEGVDLAETDLFFWFAPNMQKSIPLLSALNNHTRVIKNPVSFATTADKFLAHSLLKSKGLPVAEFALISCDDIDMMKSLLAEWKTLILKPRLGSFGRGIIKIDKLETLRDIAGMLRMEHQQKNIFIEKFYENDPEEWTSTTLINGKIIYGYRKKLEKFADWKVYDPKAIGGGSFWVDPQPVKALAEKAAATLDTSIVGFDFIKTQEGYKIVDENNFPGFYPECFEKAEKEESRLIADLIISSLSV
ncbi:MAG: hypothetical protein ACD_15C00059G0016 [uncultured bacterium]|nr:MAG: hypothetical protein ACD_15C00059G0016 [uncultured bacterium]